DRCRHRQRRAVAARSRAVFRPARLPVEGEGRFDARRRHLRRRPGRGEACQRGAQRPGGGGAHRWRDHHQAAGAQQGTHPPAAAQSGIRSDRRAGGTGLRYRRRVLRTGAQGLMGMGAVATLDNLLAARTLWHAGRNPAIAADGEPTGHAALDALLPQGGWPRRALTELLLPADGIGELSLLLPTLARCTRAGERVAVIAPPYLPYAPAWQVAGVDL